MPWEAWPRNSGATGERPPAGNVPSHAQPLVKEEYSGKLAVARKTTKPARVPRRAPPVWTRSPYADRRDTTRGPSTECSTYLV
jgi:hypothetical protein